MDDETVGEKYDILTYHEDHEICQTETEGKGYGVLRDARVWAWKR